jgi:hypothetical protein
MHPAAKADHVAALIQDGKHHPVAEAVVAPALVIDDDQAAFDQVGIAVIGEHLLQPLPGIRRIAEAEAGGDLAGDAAPLEVVDGLGRGFQLLAVEARGARHEFGQRRLLRPLGAIALFVGHLQADRRGQVLDRLDEADAGMLHQEADGAAVGAAAEAVVELLGRADREGRRFLGMERAAGAVVGPRLLQRDVALHHIDDVDAAQQFLDEALGDHAGIMPRISRRPAWP